MLILTRRVGETVYLTLSHEALKEFLAADVDEKGLEITSTILGVKGNQVRIGTNAPKKVGIDREEIYERKQRELVAANAKRKTGS